jgi:glycine dehydrogenase subunit 1
MDYVPHTDEEIKKMLDFIGVSSIEELYASIPKDLILRKPMNLPPPVAEPEIMCELSETAARNIIIKSNRDFRGGGVERHHIPPIVIDLIERGEFLTSYTPYQPEISQGILQAMFEYQTMICELTGMDVSNASSYDGGTALADTLVIAAFNRHESKRILISGCLNPQYREVLDTYNIGLGMELVDIPPVNASIDEDKFIAEIEKGARAVIIQTPNFPGVIEHPGKIKKIGEKIHAKKGLMILCVHPISLALLKTPGEMGADIAVGEGQPLGMTPSYGGPLLGFFTVKNEQLRKLPGRVIGITSDDEQNRTYVMTLQAREQHIRREKATSNICTNQALCAIAAAIYMSWYGKEGIKRLARRIASLTRYAIREFRKVKGVHLPHANQPHFNEFVINIDADPYDTLMKLYNRGFAGGISLKGILKDYPDGILITLNECIHKKDVDELVDIYSDLI